MPKVVYHVFSRQDAIGNNEVGNGRLKNIFLETCFHVFGHLVAPPPFIGIDNTYIQTSCVSSRELIYIYTFLYTHQGIDSHAVSCLPAHHP